MGGSQSRDPIDDAYAGTGDFEIWSGTPASDQIAGFYNGMWEHWWPALAKRERVRAKNYFDHDAQEASLESYMPGGWVAGQYDLWKGWTVDIPPIGEPDGELEPFNPAFTSAAVTNGALSFDDPQEDNPYFNPDADGYTFYERFAWLINWHFPVLPLVKTTQQRFLNTADWVWPRAVPGEDNEYMWEYFGMGWETTILLGMGKLWANTD